MVNVNENVMLKLESNQINRATCIFYYTVLKLEFKSGLKPVQNVNKNSLVGIGAKKVAIQ